MNEMKGEKLTEAHPYTSVLTWIQRLLFIEHVKVYDTRKKNAENNRIPNCRNC